MVTMLFIESSAGLRSDGDVFFVEFLFCCLCGANPGLESAIPGVAIFHPATSIANPAQPLATVDPIAVLLVWRPPFSHQLDFVNGIPFLQLWLFPVPQLDLLAAVSTVLLVSSSVPKAHTRLTLALPRYPKDCLI